MQPEKGARVIARQSLAALRPVLARQAGFVALALIALWFMREQLPQISLTSLTATLLEISPPQWIGALFASAISYWAIASYDRRAHAILATGVPPNHARISGGVALAISQTVGCGVITGCLARWRMLPDLSLAAALKVTLFVSGSFFLSWGVLFLLLDLARGAPMLGLSLAIAGLIAALPFLLLPFGWRNKPVALPGSRAMLMIAATACLDLGAACLAFYILLPFGVEPSLGAFTAAFLLAIMAGLMGGTPGGLGTMELALLTQLPALPAHDILVAAFAFRLVYFVIPALFAAIALIRGPLRDEKQQLVPALSPCPPFAEAGLAHQGDFQESDAGGTATALMARTGQSLVVLTQEMAGQFDWNALRQMAQAQDRHLILYKAPRRLAARARRARWQVLRISQEAVLDTRLYSVATPGRRQVRRALRKAKESGVTVTQTDKLPLPEMQAVSAAWLSRNGREKGFSVGRFDARYLSQQQIFLAHHDDKLVGFVSLHTCAEEWSLDLMRHRPDAPPGTAHALVHAALVAAREAGIPRLSLAAVSDLPRTGYQWPDALARHCEKAARAAGLTRFKAAFAPQWQPRYAISPSPVDLAVGLWDITRAVHAPPPDTKPMKVVHQNHAGNRIDPAANPWQRSRNLQMR